jgi:hypothetical protein
MVFPAVWAAAMVGTPANGTATIVIATAAAIEIFARWKRRIFGHLPLRIESVSSAPPPAFPAHGARK